MIYFDSAATTLQKPPEVARAVGRAVGMLSSPGRGGYASANRAAQVCFQCRQLAAELFDVPNPEQVVFTSCATHGLNIAIRALVQPGSRVFISGYEHNAVTRTLADIPNDVLTVADTPLFEPEVFLSRAESALKQGIDVAICCHVSNVFGYILPVEELAELCAQYRVPLIVDASQSAGTVPLSLKQLGAAYIAMPGHKGLYGPQGTGLLLCGEEGGRPFLTGGTGSASRLETMPEYLPDRFEAGTHNMPGIAGLLEGLRFLRGHGVRNILRHEQWLCRLMARQLSAMEGVRCYAGSGQVGVLSFTVDGVDCEWLGNCLAERGIAVRTGLHCAPLAHQTAGTLETGTVRVSFSAFNYEAEVLTFGKVMRQCLKQKA